ncbi:MAG: CBS domain-containing protein [Acidobacteria bacterium]|nr:CBS domain-containing protein [Acidobacteriota bacterium]
MQVQDIMVRDVKSCRQDANLALATELLWKNDCGALPVLDNGDKVIGMITDRDICIAVGTRNRIPSEIPISEVIPQKIFTTAPKEDIHAALRTMQEQKVRRLPVTDRDGKLQGILCLNDIALNANRSNALSYEDVAQTLAAICEHRLRQAVAA